MHVHITVTHVYCAHKEPALWAGSNGDNIIHIQRLFSVYNAIEKPRGPVWTGGRTHAELSLSSWGVRFQTEVLSQLFFRDEQDSTCIIVPRDGCVAWSSAETICSLASSDLCESELIIVIAYCGINLVDIISLLSSKVSFCDDVETSEVMLVTST